MAVFDDVQQWWTRLADRERRLILLLGTTFVICVFGFLGFLIQRGLGEIQAHNEEVGEALQLIAEKRDRYLDEKDQRTTSVVSQITSEAPKLGSYLESIANELELTIPETKVRPQSQKGKFIERSVSVTLRGVTLDKLAKFLKQVETKSRIVVSKQLHLKTYFNQHDKLDVEVTVATYERPKKGTGKSAEDGEGDDEEDGDDEEGSEG